MTDCKDFSSTAGALLDSLIHKIENTKNMCFCTPPPIVPPTFIPVPSPTFFDRAATAGKLALAAGGLLGVSYGAYKLHRLYQVRTQIGSVVDRFENLCGGDPPSAVLEDVADATEPDSDGDDDGSSSTSSTPSFPPGFAPRRRKKSKPEVPYFQPYSKSRDSIRGAYLPRLVATLRAKNAKIPYSRANKMQVLRMAHRMMVEHGMRAHDITRNIERVALAVFFVTEDDIEIQREEAILMAGGRLNLGSS